MWQAAAFRKGAVSSACFCRSDDGNKRARLSEDALSRRPACMPIQSGDGVCGLLVNRRSANVLRLHFNSP